MPATTSEMLGPLEKALRNNAPGLKLERIVSIERFTSGLSSQSYLIHAENADGPIRWVMRVEPEYGVIPPYDIGREYRLLREMSQSGLPAPGTLHLEEDASIVGGRFILMSFVEGTIYRNMDPACWTIRHCWNPLRHASSRCSRESTRLRNPYCPAIRTERNRHGPKSRSVGAGCWKQSSCPRLSFAMHSLFSRKILPRLSEFVCFMEIIACRT